MDNAVAPMTPFGSAFAGTTLFTTAPLNVFHATSGHENVAYSPLNLLQVLAILNLATAGDTKAQICNASGLPEDDQVIINGLVDLTETLKSKDPQRNSHSIKAHQQGLLELPRSRHHHARSQVTLLTRAFYDSTSLSPSSSLNQTLFQALESPLLTPLDFTDSSEAASKINEWLRSASDSKLTNIVPSGTLGGNFAIASSLYFNGTWKYSFANQYEGIDFTELNGVKRTRKAMTFQHKLNLSIATFQEFDAEAIELPFADDRHSMYVFKSTNSFEVYGIERGIRCSKMLAEMQPRFQPPSAPYDGVLVYMPLFQIQTTISWQPIFKLFGIKDVFDKDSADLSPMFSAGKAQVSTINQKIVLSVHDLRAVTEESRRLLREKPVRKNFDEKAVVFNVDRPFVAVIFDKWANTPLIIATVYDPDRNASVYTGAFDLTKVSQQQISQVLTCTDSVPVPDTIYNPISVGWWIFIGVAIVVVLVALVVFIKCCFFS